MCCDESYITIYKGDDTGAFGVRKIRICLEEALPVVCKTACFKLYSITREFTAAEIAANEMVVEFTNAETSALPPGRAYASFKMFDEEGRVFTASTRIPFIVKIGGAPAGFDNRCIMVGSEIAVIRISVDIDYALLANLPKINGVKIEGDKTGFDYQLNRIPWFSPEKTYRVGEQCFYENGFYQCVSEITSPGSWQNDKWQKLGKGVEELKKAFVNPEDVKLAPAAIKEYLVKLYEAIQNL